MTFQIALANGCTIQFGAVSEDAKREWITRLNSLQMYWKKRKLTDVFLLETMRESNLDRMHANDDTELRAAYTEASGFAATSEARIYNFCPYASCRTIIVSYCCLLAFLIE